MQRFSNTKRRLFTCIKFHLSIHLIHTKYNNMFHHQRHRRPTILLHLCLWICLTPKECPRMLYWAKDKPHLSLLQLKIRVHKSIYTVVSPTHHSWHSGAMRRFSTELAHIVAFSSAYIAGWRGLSPGCQAGVAALLGGDAARSESPRDDLENRKRLWTPAKESLSIAAAPAWGKTLK